MGQLAQSLGANALINVQFLIGDKTIVPLAQPRVNKMEYIRKQPGNRDNILMIVEQRE
jgi:hypothetical protein